LNEGADRRASEPLPEARDATRRTRLATERTQLAWWRTGLTAVAVGVGIGRIVPELDTSATEWPYVLLGVGFILYGVVLFWYGNLRATEIDRAVDVGRYSSFPGWVSTALAAAGGVLALATAVTVIVD
jgi:putative membrane protein